MKNTDTILLLNRLGQALAGQGVKLKRSGLLQVAASVFGCRNEHEFTAAASAGDLTPPEARYMGRTRVDNVGWMHFFQQPGGVVFAIDQQAFDDQPSRAARWILSPLGGVFDVSAMTGEDESRSTSRRGADAPVPEDRSDEMLYMTSACCEVAGVTADDLKAAGLPYGTFDGEFYPLTAEENEYVADDVVTSYDGLKTALMGRSVLHRGRKYLIPTIEMPVGPDYDAPSRDEVLAEARAYAERIRDKMASHGGTVTVDDEMDDRVSIGLMIPVSVAMLHGDYDSWREKVAWLMVDPSLPTVRDGRYPMRHEGRDFAIVLDWIGEGQDGDYATTRTDHPMLRFDAERRTPDGWEPVDGGSYCSAVRAYCDPDIARRFARMLVDTLDADGRSGPRLRLGEMSWMDETAVKQATDGRAVHDDGVVGPAWTEYGADEFVAHETYGDPDRGTSIDLRRRPDGSVRCEVYVDLDCADVFEGADMDEVRAHLKTLPCDVERAGGEPLPSYALAPRRGDDGEATWTLVPEGQDEAEWFATHPTIMPDEARFMRIDDMNV